MTNVLNTLTLITEAARVIEVQPAVVLALIDVTWWTTSPFVIRDVPRCWLSLWDNEGVVDNDRFGGTQILRSMDLARHLLKSLPWRKRFFATTAILYG